MNVFRKALLLATLFPGMCVTLAKGQTMPAIPANQLVLPERSYTLPFKWQGDSVDGHWEPYAALLLAVRLPDCDRQFYMQFDLGAPYSVFYRNKIKTFVPPADSAAVIRDCRFQVGEMPVTAREIAVKSFEDPLKEALYGEDMEVIGTIGADLIEGRVIVIDYPGEKMFIGADLPAGLPVDQQLSDLVLAGRSVLLPAIIKGKKTMLFFDTGSSAFELLTDKMTFDRLRNPGGTPIQYEVRSWGRALTAHTAPTADSLEMASRKLAITRVTYISGASAAQVEQMKKIGIGGMTGNRLFINYRLLLDMKRRQFAIL